MLVAVAACGSSGSGSNAGPGGSTGPTGSTGTTAGPGSPGFNQPTVPFYQTPNPLPPGKPGEIIRQEPFPGAPAGAQGYRVLYHSTGLNGEDIPVSGVIIIPAGTAPAGGRPIYSWAHGTTGVVDDCAPSSFPDFYTTVVPGLEGVLQAGYIVAATDYQGLGTVGVHPYLVGQSEGQGVLDAARAAKNFPNANAGNKLLINGHSQGGQASLFAGQLQPSYANEFQLVGVAAMAPAAELASLLEAQKNSTFGVVLGGYALNAYKDVYGPTNPGMDLTKILTPEAQAALPTIVGLCITTAQEGDMAKVALPLTGKLLSADPSKTPPWQGLLQQNTAGQAKTPAPLFIAQGGKDPLVLPATTQALVKTICAPPINDTVNFKLYPDADHTSVPAASIGDITTWFKDLLAGQPAPNTCSSAS